jgi:hypothetical protein
VSEYQYYKFLALDRPLTTAEQAEVRQLSTRARITATSFTNEYQWGDFRGSPDELVRRYYDAHLYFANWGTNRVMFRLPRTLLEPEVAEQYCVDPQVSVSATPDHVILDMTSEDESGYWEEDLEGSLSAIVGARSELAAGDLRPLYLAWLSGCAAWERDEDAFYDEDEDAFEDEEHGDDDDEDILEPPVPAGLGLLTASQRALADFLRVDADLLDVAAEASPALPQAKNADPHTLAAYIASIYAGEKDRLLGLVAADQATRARIELLRGFRPQPGAQGDSRPRRTVTELLNAAADRIEHRQQQAAAQQAAEQARREQQRAEARRERLDELARDPEAAWAEAERLISTKAPAQYDAAVALLKDLHELAQRPGRQPQEFGRRYAALREAHSRKPGLISRLDRSELTAM